jgi:DnaB-like helicase C terminal domain/DnaB-like helicase N terminal domain
MTLKGEQASGTDLGELLSVEGSVLRALCLTINLTGSIVKDKILDTLTKDHFYFPIHKYLFGALADMYHRGDYVVCSNLEDELHDRAVDIPEGFFLEDLFRGDPPKLPEVMEGMDRLKERASKGKLPALATPSEEQPTAPAAPQVPSHAPATTEAIPASSGQMAGIHAAGREDSLTRIKPDPEMRKTAPEPEKPAKARPGRVDAERKSRRAGPAVLSSEGEEWANYLEEVAAKQGKIIETGFSGLDEKVGGFPPGLMLLVDQDSGRVTSFLKQLTDQIAMRVRVPCLYVAFDVPKGALRVRTLARLSGVSARDIEKGRIKKGSPEWERVDRSGREAAEWLKSVFVVDAEPEMDFGQMRDMGRQLLESPGATTCLVVVDSLERMGKRGESPQAAVAGLKEISESLDVLVIGATTSKAFSSEPGVDFVAALSEGLGSGVQFEVLRAEDAHSTAVRFEYQPDIHRFIEQSGS